MPSHVSVSNNGLFRETGRCSQHRLWAKETPHADRDGTGRQKCGAEVTAHQDYQDGAGVGKVTQVSHTITWGRLSIFLIILAHPNPQPQETFWAFSSYFPSSL